MHCPTCSQSVPEGFYIGRRLASFNGDFVILSDCQAIILKILKDKAPEIATHRDIATAIWGRGKGPPNYNVAIGMHISRLRTKLYELGWWIRNYHSQGYELIQIGVSTDLPEQNRTPGHVQEEKAQRTAGNGASIPPRDLGGP